MYPERGEYVLAVGVDEEVAGGRARNVRYRGARLLLKEILILLPEPHFSCVL